MMVFQNRLGKHMQDYTIMSLLGISTLMLELFLTKIFSITFSKDFSYLSISLAMLGLGLGALKVYLSEGGYSSRFKERLHINLLYFAASTFAAFIGLVNYPLIFGRILHGSWMSHILISFIMSTTPFFFAGICTAMLFRRSKDIIAGMYSASLLGSAAGCILINPAMDLLGGNIMFAILPIIPLLGAYILGPVSGGYSKRNITAAAVCIIAINIACPSLVLFDLPGAMKGFGSKGVEHSHWDSLFLTTVKANTQNICAFGYVNDRCLLRDRYDMKLIYLDDQAIGGAIIEADPDIKSMTDLSDMISQTAYHIKNYSSVMIIGPGGGVDVLAALYFKSVNVTAVELNPFSIELVKGPYKDFAGGIYDRPNVEILAGDGRSYLKDSNRRFDLIQLTLADTLTATYGNTKTLSEGYLYTFEAFASYFEHLNPEGVLSVTRLGNENTGYTESLRVMATVLEVLESDNASKNIIVLTDGLFYSTVLVKRTGFTEQELDGIRAFTSRTKYIVIYPSIDESGPFHQMINAKDLSEYADGYYSLYRRDISPVTDDQPYFFRNTRHTDSMKTILDMAFGKINGNIVYWSSAFILTAIALVLILMIGGLIIPYRPNPSVTSTLAYFILTGFAYMVVEISLMQKMTLYLGHPAYSTSVVLSTLLFFGGLGSLITQRVKKPGSILTTQLSILSIVLVLSTFAIKPYLQIFDFNGLTPKILACILFLAPTGILMGMPFPLGMKRIPKNLTHIIPWVYGLNSFAAVLGAAASIVLSITFGFVNTLIIGTLTYGACAILVKIQNIHR